MSMDLRARQYGKVFGDWTIREMIGQGSVGKTAVFKLTRNKLTYEETTVMKVVNIIEEIGKYAELSGNQKKDYESEMKRVCEKAESEVRLMYSLRGNENIVNYLDCDWGDWEDENSFGRDLLIRMEYLENLGKQMKTKIYSEKEIIEVGKQICNALIACHKLNIVHRDIKPDNIFINRYGKYMLGDFGISKMLEESQCNMTIAGTKAYAPMEQLGSYFDHRVDIYSLGLVLYEMANGNRLPYASGVKATNEEIQKRMFSEKLPMPQNVSLELAQIIVKACSNKPNDRYLNAEEMHRKLLLLEKNVDKEQKDPYATEKAISNFSNYRQDYDDKILKMEVTSHIDNEINGETLWYCKNNKRKKTDMNTFDNLKEKDLWYSKKEFMKE